MGVILWYVLPFRPPNLENSTKFLGTTIADFITSELGVPEIKPSKSPQETKGLVFRTYKDLGHYLCEEEEQDVKEWLVKVLPASA